MGNVFKAARGVISLVVVAFITLVIWEVFTALNAAPHASLPANVQTVAGEGDEVSATDADRSSDSPSGISATSDTSLVGV